jgi:hypothetical protein
MGNVFTCKGAVLYASFSDMRDGEVSDAPLLQAESRVLSSLILQGGGQLIEANPQRIYALYLRCDAAAKVAIALRKEVLRLREHDPNYSRLSVRLLLTHGEVQLENDRIHAGWITQLPRLMAHVPELAIAALGNYLAQERPQTPPQKLSEADGVWLLSAYDEIEADQQTHHASRLQQADNTVFTHITLSAGGRQYRVRESDCPVSLGREASSGIVLTGDTASRVHGHIGFDRGKFYYADQSRNGSYVLTASGEELFVNNERITLYGKGAISPGAPLTRQTGIVVRFDCTATHLSMDDARTHDGDTQRLR